MNKNMIHSKKSILMVLSAFVLTALIGILILYIRKIAPFGDHSIIAIDCYHQYAPFLLEMRHRILEGKSLIYSWEAGLGRDLYVQTAYYTMSPLDYLVLLIQPKQICSFVSVLILLKMSLCGASFTWYLNRKYQRYDVASVIGGFLYAYCGFIACYYWNFMWLDILALFPVLAWSVEQMVRNRRFLLFTLVLAAMLIINFYLAVVTYIFTFFYYVKCLFEDSREQTERVACTLLFLAGTFIAGLCAAFILLPSLLAIRATGASDSQSPTLTVYMSLFQLVAAHFSGARPSVLSRNEDAPNIYSGVITLNADGTGTIRLQDTVPIRWDGRMLTGEDFAYPYTVSDDTITVDMDGMERSFTKGGEMPQSDIPLATYIAGTYYGNYPAERAVMYVEASQDDTVKITVRWGSSAMSAVEWTMSGICEEQGDSIVISYQDGMCREVEYHSDGTIASETTQYTQGTGTLTFKGTTAEWSTSSEEFDDALVFEYAAE